MSSCYETDHVGNIIQSNGVVNPIACQKCNVKFSSSVKQMPIKQNMPYYKCNDCNFESMTSDATLDHKIETNHTIKKSMKLKTIKVESVLKGIIPRINFKNDKPIILCDKCNGEINGN